MLILLVKLTPPPPSPTALVVIFLHFLFPDTSAAVKYTNTQHLLSVLYVATHCHM